MEAILEFDRSILMWIQEFVRTEALTPVGKFITHLGDGGALWIAVTLVLLFIRKTRPLGVICAVSMITGLLVTNLLIKNAVARIRPYEIFEELECIVPLAKDFSFPSGHTTNSLACAWVLFRRAPKKWGVPALILALLIALSRLYVGIHYPTDVLGGMVIGIGCACFAMWVVPKLEKKFPAQTEKFYKL